MSSNLFFSKTTLSRSDRERIKTQKGCVVWFTGLSGSGKSTIANALELKLHQQGKHTYILDGDNIRQGLNKDLGFSDQDRSENIRRIAEVAKLMVDAGLIVMVAFISPFRQDRAMAKGLIGDSNFLEVYINTSLEVCEQRDVKGLYHQARNGRLQSMTGISSPYEIPEQPNVILDCENLTVDSAVNQLFNHPYFKN